MFVKSIQVAPTIEINFGASLDQKHLAVQLYLFPGIIILGDQRAKRHHAELILEPTTSRQGEVHLIAHNTYET